MATIGTSYTTNDFSLVGLLDQYMARQDFIGPQVFTPLSVPQKAGVFPYRPARAFQRRSSSVKWAVGAAPTKTGSKYEKQSFECADNAVTIKVPDRLKSALIEIPDLNGSEIAVGVNQIFLEHEIDAASKLYNETNFPLSGDTGKTTSANWNTTTSTLPLEDINQGHNSIFRRCGAQRDQLTLVLPSFQVYNNLTANKNLRESIGFGYAYGDNATLPMDVFARALGIRRVLVGGKVYDSTPDAATPTLTACWNTSYAWLGVVCETNNFQEPGVGRTFTYDPDGGILTVGAQYRDDETESDKYNIKQSIDTRILTGGTDCGYLIKIVP